MVANGEEEDGHMVTTLLKRGDSFGEEEIISKSKRSATVMSQDSAELFVVYGDVSSLRSRAYSPCRPVLNHCAE